MANTLGKAVKFQQTSEKNKEEGEDKFTPRLVTIKEQPKEGAAKPGDDSPEISQH